ncbi:MAG: hypothetical protein WC461_00675 [Candidatus Paceibacterota bacterium]
MMFEFYSKNRKILLVVSGLVLLGGIFYLARPYFSSPKIDESVAVRAVVENFGYALKNVSLLSSTVAQDIKKNYKDFVAPDLLMQWEADPSKAPGRLTSSPWPDEIVIADIRQFGSGAYDVSGKIIDMTSTGMSGSRAVEIGVVKFGDKWLITGISILPYEENQVLRNYSNGGISFQYPEKLIAQYIYTQEWPPAVRVNSGTYSCAETPLEKSSLTEVVSQEVVNGRIYCVNVKYEGAAGSVYSSYKYVVPRNGKLIELSFILRYSNCGNYDEVQNQACTSEREKFNINTVVDSIVQTIKLDLLSTDDSLASQLARCLPMSDSASKQKCDELLKQITDFNSCIMAGFSIMKSNPPQCATPDGRIFFE